jgi:hypothetical protein
MLGEIETWEEFAAPAVTDYESLPRKQLRSGYADVRQRLERDIATFCSRNFVSLKPEALSELYDEILELRGLEIPLADFERKYAKIRAEVLKGAPSHLTISITLWGLRFLFPEDLLSKDIATGLQLLRDSQTALHKFETQTQSAIRSKKDQFLPHMRQSDFAKRSIVFTCFNLMEAYLNGLAWDYCQTHALETLSSRQAKLLTDTSSPSIRDKITKYPGIITGHEHSELEGQEDFLELIKPFRDSLVHPSPFAAPEKFGGYHKLQKLYELDQIVALQAVEATVSLVKSINRAVRASEVAPAWLGPIESELRCFNEEKQLTSRPKPTPARERPW